MKKRKTSLDLMREIRTTWTMNPITRVHDNDTRKSKKKMRTESKKEIKKALGDDPKSFFCVFLFETNCDWYTSLTLT